jgi:hypothetical protein
MGCHVDRIDEGRWPKAARITNVEDETLEEHKTGRWKEISEAGTGITILNPGMKKGNC